MRSAAKKQQVRNAKRDRRRKRNEKNKRPRRADMLEKSAEGSGMFFQTLMKRITVHSKELQKKFAKENKEYYKNHG